MHRIVILAAAVVALTACASTGSGPSSEASAARSSGDAPASRSSSEASAPRSSGDASSARGTASARPAATYWVCVGAESADQIHRIRFGPVGTVAEKTTLVGEIPVEMEGPHGLQITRDGKWLLMTTGHGTPDGKIWKYHLGPDTLVGPSTFLGNFPASLDITPDGLYAFPVNFNLHGEMEPRSNRAAA